MAFQDEYENDFNWNKEPVLNPCWILLDSTYGNCREVPVHVFGIGGFCRMQIGVRTPDRSTAERIICDRGEFEKMPADLFRKVHGSSYKYLGEVVLAPRPHTT